MDEISGWYKFKAPEGSQITDFEAIERSDWECELFGIGRSMTLRPMKGKVPNWFWRWMQFLILGNKWVKRFKIEAPKGEPLYYATTKEDYLKRQGTK